MTVEGRGSYIPFVRGRQFAAIAAATRDRVDLGLRFTDPPAAKPELEMLNLVYDVRRPDPRRMAARPAP